MKRFKSAWMLMPEKIRGGIRRRRPAYMSPALRRMQRLSRQARVK